MNKKNIIITILVLIVLILSVILFNKTAPGVMGNGEVATTTGDATTADGKMAVDSSIKPATVVNESNVNTEYTNGVYWGIIKKSAIANGKLILTIDFLQSFSTSKATLLAAIEDDVCKFPSNQGIKSKQEFINKVSSLNESEIGAFVAKTNCFPNGISYYRNSSAQLTSKDVAANFIAYYPAYPSTTITNTGNATTLNTFINKQGPSNPVWQITIRDNKVVSLNQPYTK